MESCTEGLLCSTIASSPESCAYFKGGLLACSVEAKVALGLDAATIEQYGEESSQVAEAMAEIAHKNFKADIGIGVGGTMNPAGNSGDAFIGFSSDKFKQSFTHVLLGNRSRMKQRAVYATLFDLRKILLEEV